MSQHIEETISCIGISVVRNDDKVLVGIRAGNIPLAGYHEFPGGKCYSDESSNTCAERECLEETGLKVFAKEQIFEAVHQYEHGTVNLHFWFCELDSSSETAMPKNDFRWCAVSELNSLNFPEANNEVLRILQTRFTTGS